MDGTGVTRLTDFANGWARNADWQTVPAADVRVEWTEPSPVKAGSPLNYNIVVRNDGPASAQNVRLTDILPKGATFQSIDHSRCAARLRDGVPVVECDLGNLMAGSAVTLHLTVKVTALPEGSVTNLAKAHSPITVDPKLSNNEFTSSTKVY